MRSLSPERSPIAMKDIKWLSQNCTVGFLVAGMWNNRYYSNAATTITTCSRASGHDMLASGDADGCIRLFRCVLIFIVLKIVLNSIEKILFARLFFAHQISMH